ncbi:MAG: DUF445 family protein [Lachnospiraceae bacterium]|nr:DUF445 family protein [Lachnospiraceae bacterium]
MLHTILHYISGPVIGAVIGAFTNYLAIKMLFRPLKPVKIGRFTLPLTPGVIPRHQEALADALSNTVYENFFTNTDIEGIFMTDEMTDRFSEGIYQLLEGVDLSSVGDGLSEESKLKVKEAIYRKIHEMILNTDISGIVSNETAKIIRTKVKGGLVSNIILSEEITGRIASYAGRQVQDYIRENDVEILYPILEKQSSELKKMNLADLTGSVGIDREIIMETIKKGYRSFMGDTKQKIAETFHIKEFIHEKIMELDPGEIERLVNKAIKREMNYLVYLGALLGFIIGIINIFV